MLWIFFRGNRAVSSSLDFLDRIVRSSQMLRTVSGQFQAPAQLHRRRWSSVEYFRWAGPWKRGLVVARHSAKSFFRSDLKSYFLLLLWRFQILATGAGFLLFCSCILFFRNIRFLFFSCTCTAHHRGISSAAVSLQWWSGRRSGTGIIMMPSHRCFRCS